MKSAEIATKRGNIMFITKIIIIPNSLSSNVYINSLKFLVNAF
jgi:hypothetical protein